MATKHFFPKQEGLVVTALKGLAAANPSLAVLEHDKVIFTKNHDSNKVAVLSGGGSGHEPGHAGFVGKGMLAASVCGDVFASPNTKQIKAGCNAVQSDEGYIFVVTNYTGDMLHFGLACEQLRAAGHKAGIIVSADDVSVGRKHGGLVGRRGLSGTIYLDKIAGAAADAGLPFEDVLEFGQNAALNVVTINAGLDHCHIPGHEADEDYGRLTQTQCEIGLGIHNEPGVKMLDHIPPVEELVELLLKHLLDPNDEDRAFVKFNPKDKVALMIGNLGGVSAIEQFAFTEVALQKLKTVYNIAPSRVFSGQFMTSLNAPILSITLVNITQSATAKVSESRVFEFLDKPTQSTAWTANHYHTQDPVDLSARIASPNAPHVKTDTSSGDVKLDPTELEQKLRAAARNVIAAEPDLTEWDTKMGDGDCGKTLESGSNGLLRALDQGLAKSGSLLQVLETVVEITEDQMGGTLGAIFAIYLSSFAAAVRNEVSQARKAGNTEVEPSKILTDAANDALKHLRHHTPASEGDRTVMDVLIPFCRSLADGSSLKEAEKVANKAAEGTRHIKPKLGRATYVGGVHEMSILPPDPGAWGLYEIIRGLALN
jgi:triose/dihydroxyacetone kinase / FAD-AMP lyase (cyclizing)